MLILIFEFIDPKLREIINFYYFNHALVYAAIDYSLHSLYMGLVIETNFCTGIKKLIFVNKNYFSVENFKIRGYTVQI